MAAPEQHVALTADLVGLVRGDEELGVVMVRRGHPPFVGSLALPGGFVDDEETLERAAVRELEEETGVVVAEASVLQVGAFGQLGRDPRGRNVSVAFLALLPEASGLRGGDDAAWAGVVGVAAGQPLTDERVAFDHREVIASALERAERALGAPREAAVLLGQGASLRAAAAWLELVRRARSAG